MMSLFWVLFLRLSIAATFQILTDRVRENADVTRLATSPTSGACYWCVSSNFDHKEGESTDFIDYLKALERALNWLVNKAQAAWLMVRVTWIGCGQLHSL
jgi:hypothetical protein